MGKKVVRNKTISLAVTQEMYDWIKYKTQRMDTTPSTFSFEWLQHSFGEEIAEYKNRNRDSL